MKNEFESGRRFVLKMIPFSVILTGCASKGGFGSPGGGSILGYLKGDGTLHGAPEPLTEQEAASAANAKAIFDKLLATKTLPANAGSVVTTDQVMSAYNDWNNAKGSAKVSPGAIDIGGFESAALPLANLLFTLDKAYLPYQTTGGIKSPKLAQVKVTKTGEIVMPPGGIATFTHNGFCLDLGIPAPRVGEKFHLIPIGEMLQPQLQPVYKKMVMSSNHEIAQSMLWNMRSLGTSNQVALTPWIRSAMEKEVPGSSAVYEKVYHQEAARAGLQKMVNNFVPHINVNGRTFSLLDLASPDTVHATTKALLGQMAKMPVSGSVPNDNSEYTTISPGVAVEARGVTVLGPRMMIVNTNTTPFVFDPKEWVASSTRAVQRVAMGVPQNVKGGQVPLDHSVPSNAAPKSVLDKICTDIRQDIENIGLNHAQDAAEKLFDKLGPGAVKLFKSPFVEKLAMGVPVIGPALALATLVKGSDLVTGNPLTWADWTLLGLGCIPGTMLMGRILPEVGPMIKAALAEEGPNLAKDLYTVGDISDIVSDLTTLFGGQTITDYNNPKSGVRQKFLDAINYYSTVQNVTTPNTKMWRLRVTT
jgi:hypothetical protein